ncbi:uncharacterized protein SPPG_02376 [Spizellomyces punctatus DAOM BR117]|uniref:SOSS complex subunit A homolog n=1 Tax=Spizellomyces punctatus (strain DAOM BR117) TaxID=645134 RepID=A0A0L0HQE0_SPIPD|nr:uncharacterized protein SPPG_02376 [Spizellomyces punctatus DAOM BR117]KND03332.1 hypothetical protein SPPG_02376 [Spizellomyces punctatus DAOM BR117]|eukprot:XP_016611371.1 hypothetical protein SPPG_02376 [Spizellomyces punctatus DAOM BR117]
MARHVLFSLDEKVDKQDPREKELRAAYEFVQELRSNRNEGDFLRVLHEQIDSNNDQINGGLLYGALTEQKSSQYATLLQLVVTDNFNYIITKLFALTEDVDLVNLRPFRMLRSHVRLKIVWLVDKIAETNLERVQSLVMLLTRHIKSGDPAAENIALARGLVNILNRYWRRLDTRSDIIPTTVYSFLRLIADHSQELDLRQAEVDYVCTMIRNRFRDCLRIGRDLVRLLLTVSRIPGISDILRDMFISPKQLDPSFERVQQLLATPSPPFVIAQRITPEMDIKMRFILDKVKTKMKSVAIRNYRNVFLSNTDESIYVDLIRFICTGIQPPNTILGSKIVQRWEVIQKLLSGMKTSVAIQDVKLALFFDWLFWNPAHDNIMYIEPAMLMMERACQPPSEHPVITATSIEYLYYVVDNYLPKMASEIRRNLTFAMFSLVQMGVVRSLRRIYTAPSLEQDTREQLENLFSQFTQLNDGQRPPIPSLLTSGELPQQTRTTTQGMSEAQEVAFKALASQIKQLRSQAAPATYAELFQLFVTPDICSTECMDDMFAVLQATRNDTFLDHLVAAYSRYPEARPKLLNILLRGYTTNRKFGGYLGTYVMGKLALQTSEISVGLYKDLANHMRMSLGDRLVKDMQVIHEQQQDVFYADILPIACRFFPDECHSNVDLLDVTLSIIDFPLCAQISLALSKGQYRLFGVKNPFEVLKSSLENWDELNILFLWKLLIAEKGGRVDEIEAFMESLSNLPDLGNSLATIDGLMQLCKTAPATPRLMLAALTRHDLNGQDLLKHWWTCGDHTKFSASLADALIRCKDLDMDTHTMAETQGRLQILLNHLASWKADYMVLPADSEDSPFSSPLVKTALANSLMGLPSLAAYTILLQ